MEVHSIAFLTGWTPLQAKKWLKDHGFTPIKKVHIVKVKGHITQMRYRIKDPTLFSRFVTKKVWHGNKAINIILGVP